MDNLRGYIPKIQWVGYLTEVQIVTSAVTSVSSTFEQRMNIVWDLNFVRINGLPYF